MRFAKRRLILLISIVCILFFVVIKPVYAAGSTKNGLVKENGYYYYYESGKKATGWRTIDGYKYYFLSTGKAVTGVKKIGSYTYVFADNARMKTGYAKVTVNGVDQFYYLGASSGRSLKGRYLASGATYSFYMYFNGDGTVAKDELKTISGYLYYFNGSGKMVTDTLKTYNNDTYYFGKNGKAVTGWQTIGSYKYYFLASCKAATGVQKIGSYTYVFAGNGKMYTGYRKVTDGDNVSYYFLASSSGKSISGIHTIPGTDYAYYFNGDGTILIDTIKKISGYYYYFTPAGKKANNMFKVVNGYVYYFDNSGKALTGWQTIEGNRYYFYSNGRAATGICTIGRYTYVFTGGGKLYTGFTKIQNGDDFDYFYLANSSGKSMTGLRYVEKYDNYMYFYGDGRIEKDSSLEIKGDLYHFSSSGLMTKDSFSVSEADGNRYYFGSDGKAVTGWQTINERLYYFTEDHVALTGLHTIDNDIYLFDEYGRAKTGYCTYTDETDNIKYYYYFGTDGKALTGWQDIEENRYYFYSNGRAATGLSVIEGDTYVFTPGGKLYTGFTKIQDGNDFKYYCLDNISGKLLTGLRYVEKYDNYMYFYGDGTIEKDSFIEIEGDFYHFSSSGFMTKDSFSVSEADGNRYYFGSDGKAVTGWQTINECIYYFNEDHVAQIGFQTIDNDIYLFDEYGRAKIGYYSYTDETDNVKYYYFFGEDGKSLSGKIDIPERDHAFYYKGDGTIYMNEFVTEEDGTLYWTNSGGKVCKDSWRNIAKADFGIDDPEQGYYVHCDPQTGAVSQGLTTFDRYDDKTDTYVTCTYFLDKDAERGYRMGFVEDADGNTYYMESADGVGYMYKGYFCDIENQKVYYFDPETGILKKGGTVSIPGTSIEIPVADNGEMDYMAASVIQEDDSYITRLIRYSLSQMFKPYGKPSYSKDLMIDLNDVPKYNCSGYVIRMYAEVNRNNDGNLVDIFKINGVKNNDLVLFCDLTDDLSEASTGDIIFYNCDECDKFLEIAEDAGTGKTFMIDDDGDGVCDRKHEDIVLGDRHAHVHHLGIYIGNGMMIHAANNRGVVIQPLSEMANSKTVTLFGYGSIKEEYLPGQE